MYRPNFKEVTLVDVLVGDFRRYMVRFISDGTGCN